jgi:hypothetical protein
MDQRQYQQQQQQYGRNEQQQQQHQQQMYNQQYQQHPGGYQQNNYSQNYGSEGMQYSNNPSQYAFHNSNNNQGFEGGGGGGGANSFLGAAATQVMMDPNAWKQLGNQAFSFGENYVHSNVGKYVGKLQSMRFYWNVTNSYVMKKVFLIIFPFRHKAWSRQLMISENTGQIEGFKPPRLDINCPDMYIPVMSYVTYILLVATIMGFENRFTPEILGITGTTALFFCFLQTIFLRLGIYLLNISTVDPIITLTDLVAYPGYSFVALIFVQLSSFLISNTILRVVVFIYASIALGWFSVIDYNYNSSCVL